MTDKALASIILFCIVICLMRNYILMNELFPAAAAVCGILFSISYICTCIFVCPQQRMNLSVPSLQKLLLRWDSGSRK